MNDTSEAVAFLKVHNPRGFTDGWFTVEEIHNAINAKCGIPALARNLRRRRSNGELFARKRPGKTYIEYSYNYLAEVDTPEGISIWQRLKEIVGI